MAFLEQLFPEDINTGTAFGESFSQMITQTASGDRYVHEYHPYPTLSYEVSLENRSREWLIENGLELYRLARGGAVGFRVRNYAENSTNNYRDAPTNSDQLCEMFGDDYQIVVWYGPEGDTTQARRRVRKPVDGSAVVSVSGVAQASRFSVDYTTGLISFESLNYSIAGITKGVNTVIDATGHTYNVGDTLYIDGVTGMTEINGVRCTIISIATNLLTVDIDSTAFSDYISGGETYTAPQSGEQVRAGCYFDFPMYFDDIDMVLQFVTGDILSTSTTLVELLNP